MARPYKECAKYRDGARISAVISKEAAEALLALQVKKTEGNRTEILERALLTYGKARGVV